MITVPPEMTGAIKKYAALVTRYKVPTINISAQIADVISRKASAKVIRTFGCQ